MPTTITRRRLLAAGSAGLALPAAASFASENRGPASGHAFLPMELSPVGLRGELVMLGIGPTGYALVADNPILRGPWPRDRYLVVPGDRRIPGAVGAVRCLTDGQADLRGRGARLALVAGDLADPDWLPMTVAACDAAARAGLTVLAVPAPAEERFMTSALAELLQPGRATAVLTGEWTVGTCEEIVDLDYRKLIVSLDLSPLRITTERISAAAVASRLVTGPGRVLVTTRRLHSWRRGDSVDLVEAELRREIEEALGSTRAHPLIGTLAFEPMPPAKIMSRLARSVRRMLLPARPLVAYQWWRPEPTRWLTTEICLVVSPLRSSRP
jgi:hypothetical protein